MRSSYAHVARRLLVAALLLPVAAHAGAPRCESFPVPALDVDLAPPNGMLDVCSRDAALCARLTAGYPASVETLAYFVTPEEWARRDESDFVGFSRYLIAQATDLPAAEFDALRKHFRAREGALPDHSAVPEQLRFTGRANLGILEDTADAVVMGQVARLTIPARGPEEIVLASSNTAFLAGDDILSLYVFADTTVQGDVEPLKRLTGEWLTCLRAANAEADAPGTPR